MHWLILTGAIAFEIAGTVSMKLSEGFTRTGPSVLIFVFYAISFLLLTLALKKIEVSTAYAIWSGLGTVAITFIGVFWFKESADLLKFVCVGMIVIGVVGLKLLAD
ncbi:MAG: DMT family transporter [Rhodospirillaceae bacterium]